MKTVTATAALVLSVLGLAVLGPADAGSVVGIDLGGEFIKAALVKPRVPLEIVLTSEGQRKSAAMVGFVDGEQIISNAALNQLTRRPLNVVGYLKMLLGKGPEALGPQWLKDAAYFNEWTEIPEVGTLQTNIKTGLGEDLEDFSVVELMAMLLDKTREDAELFAEEPIKDVVLTVPPYWSAATPPPRPRVSCRKPRLHSLTVPRPPDIQGTGRAAGTA